jgi:hypothetical protein
VGRHSFFEGVASEQIDGVSARWEITPRTGISVFGGSPLDADFDGRSGDLAYGGRVYQRIAQFAEIGLSALKEGNDGDRFREEVGPDIYLRPARKVEVRGQSSYNLITDGWREHSYTVRVFPAAKLTLTGLYTHASYKDFFVRYTPPLSPRPLNVFSSTFFGENEKITKAGGSVDYVLGKATTVGVDFIDYDYEIMGPAAYYGGRLKTVLGGTSAGASIHRMDGDTDRLRYLETGLYAARGLEEWNLSLNAVNIHYDIPFNELRNAYAVNGTARYEVSDSLTAGLSLEFSKTPDFSHNTTAFVSLVYKAIGEF